MALQKLPDAEFALMRIIWANPSPISTNQIIAQLDGETPWKPQTVLTLLSRLTDRGFLWSERAGKERIYTPLIDHQDYLAFESSQFMRRFHGSSFISLVNTLYDDAQMSEADIEEIRAWLREKE